MTDVGFEFITTYVEWLASLNAEMTMFRGHADSRWDIIPSGYRPGAHGVTSAFHLEMWKDMAARFAHPRPSSKLERLVLAQHHGIPTNLLDWTSNPLIALFFGCAGPTSEAVDGQIIAIDRSFFDEDERKVERDPFLSEEISAVLINASSMNARSMAQDSYMSVHPKDWSEIDNTDYNMDTFHIPSQKKQAVLSALEVLGISEERLYTDIGAVAAVYRRKVMALDMMHDALKALDNGR